MASTGNVTSRDISKDQIEELPRLDKSRLRELWQETFEKPPHPGLRRELMLPILAFHLQQRDNGGLAGEDQRRLENVMTSLKPGQRSQGEARERFKAGTRIVREWRGKTYEVEIIQTGYLYQGREYTSLSQIACEITGTHWSGPAFFGTRRKAAK
jgi:Protein of unknown function (DUF2924)